jgi:hypothetical protein
MALWQDWNAIMIIISRSTILVFIVNRLDNEINTSLLQNRYRITTEIFFFYLIFYLQGNRNNTKQTSRLHGRDVELMGTFFIWFFSPNIFSSLVHSVEKCWG